MLLNCHGLFSQNAYDQMLQQASKMLQTGNINQNGLQKMFDSFSKSYEQEVENIRKKNATEAYNRAREKAKNNLHQKAIESYNIALNYYTTTDLYNGRGISEYALGEYENALESFNKALELEPNDQVIIENKQSTLNQLLKVKSAPVSIYDIKIANVDGEKKLSPIIIQQLFQKTLISFNQKSITNQQRRQIYP